VNLAAFLAGAKLGAHAEALQGAGYGETADLEAAADDDLGDVGLKKPEIKRLRRDLAKVLHGE
jgi:hypothetical protein